MKGLQATPQLLDAVADRIAQEYLQFGIELGLPFKKILQCRMNHRSNTVKIVREMLGEWLMENQAENFASVYELAVALLRSGCSVKLLHEVVRKTDVFHANQTINEESKLDRQKNTSCLLM